MYFFYDTETSGLPNFKQKLDHPSQPYVLQLAGILTDHEGKEIQSINLLINNGDIEIDDYALAVHGISVDTCKRYGITPQHAISIFSGLSRVTACYVGHNLKFDNFFMRIMYSRFHPKKLEPKIGVFRDTMEMSLPILNLPPTDKMLAAGFNKPKNPNLSECYKYFFDKELEGAHDALVDVRACKDVYFEIKKRQG